MPDDVMKAVGGTIVRIPGERLLNISIPMVQIVLTPKGVGLRSKWAMAAWAASDYARYADPQDPDPRRHLWAATWSEIVEMRFGGRRFAVRTETAGGFIFSTRRRAEMNKIVEYLKQGEAPLEARKPNVTFLYRHGRRT